MITWKVVLVVIAIAILFMAIGMWLGYRYISEQDDIRYEAQNYQSDMVYLSNENSTEEMFRNVKHHSYCNLKRRPNYENSQIYILVQNDPGVWHCM